MFLFSVFSIEDPILGKVIQHCKNIVSPLPDLLRSVEWYQTQIVTPISNLLQRRQLRSGAVKKFTFSQKSGKNKL